MDRKRDYQIDTLRAVTILMVVFGHSIILYSSTWHLFVSPYEVPFLDQVKKVINLIQMPAFFSISGYLFSQQYRNTSFGGLIIRKFRRLMIPYYLTAAVWMIPVKMAVHFSQYAGRTFFRIFWEDIVLFRNNAHLWFLPTLFLCFILGKGLLEARDRLPVRHGITHACLFAVLLLASVNSRLAPSGPLRRLAQEMVWFWAGVILSDGRSLTAQIRRSPAARVIVPLLAVLGIFICLQGTLNGAAAENATVLLLLLSLYALVPPLQSRGVMLISRYSFGIYLFHSPLIYITFTYGASLPPVLVVLINFVLFGSLALMMSMGIAKTRLRFLEGM